MYLTEHTPILPDSRWNSVLSFGYATVRLLAEAFSALAVEKARDVCVPGPSSYAVPSDRAQDYVLSSVTVRLPATSSSSRFDAEVRSSHH